ncbi:MAG: c-type cytochrome, partial [Terracidiphilus sp.]
MKGARFAAIAAAIVVALLTARDLQVPVDAAAQFVAAPSAAADPGANSYAEHCAICHGDQREGILPGFPPLLGISHQMNATQIAAIIHTGKGRMPGFPTLQSDELTALLHFLAASAAEPASEPKSSDLARTGEGIFHQNCAFCHGRDAMGGETGPDLTSSKLVRDDKTGEQMAAVVRVGRPANKMPAFNFSSYEIQSLVAFIRYREAA